MQIDFVIPWVDGSDPMWVSLRNQYAHTMEDHDPSRYRDWEILRYWFRSVEQYAPWVHKIHFITCGQFPEWLNREHPKLHLVDHRDYIPAEYLPTFSSHTIELNFHRIPGLAEHFVYFNDDMFLNAEVSPKDFFVDGLPRDCAVLDFPAPGTDVYASAQRNVIAWLNDHFDKYQVLKDHKGLWFNPLYGKYAVKNLVFAWSKNFTGIRNFHIPSSLCKSTLETIWESSREVMDRTCRNRFRNTEDVNQYIISYVQLCSGQFVPRNTNFGKCYRIELDRQEMEQDILHSIHKVICINDHPGITDFPQEKEKLISLMQAKYPKQSSYER